MTLAALLLYVAGVVMAFGVRSAVQGRRTGDTGLRLDAGPAWSTAWWAKLSFLMALGLGAAGPTAALLGLAPMTRLDHPAVQAAGIVFAVAGAAFTLAAQTGMGASWRVGVDHTERAALVTTGAFAIVRNPIFTAMSTTMAGIALMVPNPVTLAAVAALIAFVQLQVRGVEEPYLVHTHGPVYLAYTERTGRFLPRLGLRRPKWTRPAR